ncbi:hypothetical protein FE394_05065 [Xenorhabdus sp. Reich]|uniref:Uncharacterized protein n=1 Tax=Xenorhabdus littoralis TaxID=2582835 RepID=A0ABU4SIU5_9GAMM|nr:MULTISPECIES: hypothetical protein [unclassified Xenorhabdus]MDX7990236.1 hypothetical protein [Xenorhabdus sp. psl]MDX7998575.1 hypothetical protein [Xenorhabdus sp. Reich]
MTEANSLTNIPVITFDEVLKQKFLPAILAVNAIVSIMRDDLLGENMKNHAVKAVKYQANEKLSAGSVGVLFFPLHNQTFKKPLN